MTAHLMRSLSLYKVRGSSAVAVSLASKLYSSFRDMNIKVNTTDHWLKRKCTSTEVEPLHEKKQKKQKHRNLTGLVKTKIEQQAKDMFQANWLRTYPWLDNCEMHCSICKAYGAVPFNSQSYKTSTLRRNSVRVSPTAAMKRKRETFNKKRDGYCY